MNARISVGVSRPKKISITVNGAPIDAYQGESLATVLFAAGITAFNSKSNGEPRGPFCNMGTCFECLVGIEQPENAQKRWVRACMTQVSEGMSVIADSSFKINSDLFDELNNEC